MALVDIRVDTGFPKHHKTKQLILRLGPDAGWKLLTLWCEVRPNRPDGDLTGWSDERIAAASDWSGDVDTWIRALIEIEWLEGPVGARRLRSWDQHQKYALQQDSRSEVARNAANMRWAQKRHAQSMPEASIPDAPLPAPAPNPVPTPEPTPTPVHKKELLSGKPDDVDGIPYAEIVGDLNLVTGRSFEHDKAARKTRSMIRSLWANKKYRDLAVFQLVHRNRFEKWGSDLERKQYLRPSTLYQPEKFEAYLNDARSKPTAKKPTIAQLTGDHTGATERYLKEHEVNGNSDSDSSISQRAGGELQQTDERLPAKRV